ncbi:MAG: T9SS type A sorting domain-containing protein [Chitinophagaceae bacterium]|nr:MAG: T9SS type A sorting domain-containing protein [Chitinophagaceae bacterium]
MYKRVTILFMFLACTITFAYGQNTYPPHGQGSSTQDPPTPVKVLKVYPNPASSQINFEVLNNNEGAYEIIVYNFLGKRLDDLKNVSGTQPLDLSNYFSGIYIYQVRDQKGNLVESGKFNVIRQ